MSRAPAASAPRGGWAWHALPWLAVAAGAALGTSARYGLDLLLPHTLDAVPWSTIFTNTVGSFILGLLAASAWRVVAPWLRAGLGAGLLGSFTTFSSIMIAAVTIAQGGGLAGGSGSLVPGSFGLAAAIVIGSVVAGMLAALLGILLGRRIASARLDSRPTIDDLEDA